MKTRAFPYVEIAPATLEIGEFDCASMFLLKGDKKALLIDTGIGLGDLAGFVKTFTDLPLQVVYTHNHLDHVGGAGAFAEGWIHPQDKAWFRTGGGISTDRAVRQGYVQMIANREKGWYPYNLDADLVEWGPEPVLHDLHDGQVIDLGGREVQVIACPGHTPGSVAFLDRNTRTLFLGDACNGYIILTPPLADGSGFLPVTTARAGLQKLLGLHGEWERAYNGHYDFRDLGQPLPLTTLEDAIALMGQILEDKAEIVERSTALKLREGMEECSLGGVRIAFNPQYARG